MSKIGRGGDSGILSICNQPSSNSFSQNSPSWSPCPGTCRARKEAGGAHSAPPLPDTCCCWVSRKVKCPLVQVAAGGWQCFVRAHLLGVDRRPPAGEHPPSARPCGFPSRDLITGRMSGMNASCADPSGTRPVPPLGLGQCTHFTTLASSSLSVLSSVTSSSACPGMRMKWAFREERQRTGIFSVWMTRNLSDPSEKSP